MKTFMEEYGKVIVVAIIVVALITIALLFKTSGTESINSIWKNLQKKAGISNSQEIQPTGTFEYQGRHYEYIFNNEKMTFDNAKLWIDGLGNNYRFGTALELQALSENIDINNSPLRNAGVWYASDPDDSDKGVLTFGPNIGYKWEISMMYKENQRNAIAVRATSENDISIVNSDQVVYYVNITSSTQYVESTGKYKITFVLDYTTNPRVAVQEVGFVVTTKPVNNIDDLEIGKTGITQTKSNLTNSEGKFTANYTVSKPTTIASVRAYIIYQPRSGDIQNHTFYSNIKEGGFSLQS